MMMVKDSLPNLLLFCDIQPQIQPIQ
jgi:hypothetical protein